MNRRKVDDALYSICNECEQAENPKAPAGLVLEAASLVAGGPKFLSVGAIAGKKRFFLEDKNSSRRFGFALLIVLWAAVFLAFLMTQILANSHTAMNLTENLRAAAQARAADDGAVHEAIFQAFTDWPADGQPHALAIGGIAVTVTVKSLAGMVNPNTAALPLLAGLIRAAGAPPDAAAGLAENIILWRAPAPSQQAEAALLQQYRAAGLAYGPPGRPFLEIDQLSDVLGMTPALLAALKPHLSLYQPGDPQIAAADQVVRQAISYASAAGLAESGYAGAPVVAIAACAAGPAPLCRHAIVSLSGLGALPAFVIERLADGRS